MKTNGKICTKLITKRLEEIGISPQEAEEIRSFTRKKKLAFQPPPESLLEPETIEWLGRVAHLLGVNRKIVYNYFFEKYSPIFASLLKSIMKTASKQKIRRAQAQVEKEIANHQKWCKFKTSTRGKRANFTQVGEKFCWTFESNKYRKARLEDGVSAKEAQNNFEVGHEYT